MRDPLPRGNGLGQPDGRTTTHADDAVSPCNTSYSIIDNALRNIDKCRVEDPSIEVWYQRLDPSCEAKS